VEKCPLTYHTISSVATKRSGTKDGLFGTDAASSTGRACCFLIVRSLASGVRRRQLLESASARELGVFDAVLERR